MVETAAAVPQRTSPGVQVADPAYESGVCNIGPAEIARRRRAGHAGVIASVGLLALLVAIDAPPLARLLVALPAAVAASGYLQAYLRFCANYGARGVYNLGAVGAVRSVADADARRRDRRRATMIGLASGLIGLVVAALTTVLPIAS